MRNSVVWSVAFVVCAMVAALDRASAQTWNDARTRALVELATQRRAHQIADTALADYKATAHGYLTFLAQVGEGFTEPPRVVKADELALEVYWRAPGQSKQRIIGQRDTLLLPTDIAYHRDHLGIVQGNFPGIIRLGDGDEVEDVPHPFSPGGLDEYDFAIRDSLSIRLPDRTLDVYEVRFRPRDDGRARVIGAAYIDRTSGDVVRLAFGFTRSAFRDRQLVDLSVVLENALVEGRFWLPRRQEIEIRRAGTWLDYPARGIIRGRWEICCYEVNVGLDRSLFSGPEIDSAPPRVLAQRKWESAILDSLPPDVRAVTAAEIARVKQEASELVRSQALARTTGINLSARRISDFVQVNRVEGLALGAALTQRLGRGMSVLVGGRWGTADHEMKGAVTVTASRASGASVRVFAERSYRDAGDVQETSLVRNSFAAQEYGSDYTEPYDVRRVGLGIELRSHGGILWEAEAASEVQTRVDVNATPDMGRYEPTIDAWSIEAWRIALSAERPTSLSLGGIELHWRASARGGVFTGHDTSLSSSLQSFGRAFMFAAAERPIGSQRLVLRTMVGAAGGSQQVPPQELVYLGGPTSAPGYRFHEFASRFGVSQHVEWQSPIPFVGIPLGRYGRSPGSATLAPFAHAIYVAKPSSGTRGEGWYPSLGLGLQFFFELVRIDVARGLRGGRWTFSLDISRDFWGVL